MKPRISISDILTFIAAVAIVGGCLGKKGTNGQEPSPEQPEAEKTRPYYAPDLPEDQQVVPAQYPADGGISMGGDLVVRDTTVPLDAVDVPQDTTVSAETIGTHQVYRVQLFSTKLFGDARWELRVAEEIFDRPVHIDYELPYYKVRVGDFGTRDEAEKYAKRVRVAGYPDAWVVTVTINVRETAPLYPGVDTIEALDEDSDETNDQNDENE